MSDKKRNVPVLRFNGFSDAWEQRKLGELGKVTTGKAFSSIDFDEQGEYLVITNKDISISSRSQNVVTDRINVSDKNIIEKYNLNGENILVTMDGVNLGKTAMYSNENALLAQRVGRIQSTQLEFVYQITSSNNFFMTMRTLSVGNAIKHISLSQISNYSTLVPNNEAEQQKIGELFKHLDNTIALHQRKLDTLKQMKNGFLQQLFPENGEKLPRVRFTGFEGEWEQRKLLGLSNKTYGGGTPRTTVEEYWQGDIPWIQSSDLYTNKLFDVTPKKYISNFALKESSTKLVPANSIAIVTRVGVGKLAFMPFEYATSQDFLSFSNLNIDSIFAMYSLYNMLQKELNSIQGTSIKGITKTELLEKKIVVPKSVREQQKIGIIFKQLDDMIYLHQNKLDKLNILKSTYLKNMFI
ncbi:restriction endonuclease subunit S [Listeria booriae]|uniref:restriction endonuclease subunit S n=1 Tax=Listeria booriae TaxID=1552123 RepID=UPI001624285F|nr:restriction endonuclease subunit S [Listeria booriae]MBC1945099.1 restriction endonuclease subunit S [Listeria booriae]